jgi:hypothetical protein
MYLFSLFRAPPTTPAFGTTIHPTMTRSWLRWSRTCRSPIACQQPDQELNRFQASARALPGARIFKPIKKYSKIVFNSVLERLKIVLIDCVPTSSFNYMTLGASKVRKFSFDSSQFTIKSQLELLSKKLF